MQLDTFGAIHNLHHLKSKMLIICSENALKTIKHDEKYESRFVMNKKYF